MRINNLHFKFNKEQKSSFFKDLSFEIPEHTVSFLQGDNGIGKSTLFTILQGSVASDALLTGTVVLEHTQYTLHQQRPATDLIKQVHTVRQDYNSMLADQFTFIENLQLANMQQYPTLSALPAAQFLSLAHELGIPTTIPVCRLSGGQRQLLAIFMALQKPTKLLLLDEPTATLDSTNARMVITTLYRLAAELKITVLLICHDKELVQEYAHHKNLVMRIAADGQRVVVC